ncbi:MAG: endonuclease/exonuclease/phosphatase family protein [Pseudomonadota bacterium]
MRMKALMSWILACAGLGLCAATLLGFAGEIWWRFGLLDHFRVQYVGLLLLIEVAGFLLLWRRWVGLLLIPLIVNLVPIVDLALKPRGGATLAATQLTVFHANIDHTRPRADEIVALLSAAPADIVFVQEVTPETLVQLQTGLTGYRLVLAAPRRTSHGSAMFVPVTSTLEIQDARIIDLPNGSQRPLLVADLVFDGAPLRVMSVHVTLPKTEDTAAAQARELVALAEWANDAMRDGPSVVLVGDFNATPFSVRFRDMLERGGLLNSQVGWPLQMTWPAGWPMPMQLAIDHLVHSPDLSTLMRETGPAIGSDHLPLRVTLARRP